MCWGLSESSDLPEVSESLDDDFQNSAGTLSALLSPLWYFIWPALLRLPDWGNRWCSRCHYLPRSILKPANSANNAPASICKDEPHAVCLQISLGFLISTSNQLEPVQLTTELLEPPRGNKYTFTVNDRQSTTEWVLTSRPIPVVSK